MLNGLVDGLNLQDPEAELDFGTSLFMELDLTSRIFSACFSFRHQQVLPFAIF